MISKRFDRTADGRRKHFASAMTLLGLTDGCYAKTGNRDDHFRNHGFLLTPKGWTLSPAYDLNPTLNEYQALLINSTTNQADLNTLLDSSEGYMIGRNDAEAIIDEVKSAVRQWKSVANRLGISKREMDLFEQVYRRVR